LPQRCGAGFRAEGISTSFFEKKEAKKLHPFGSLPRGGGEANKLLLRALPLARFATTLMDKSFLLLFFKKEAFLPSSCPPELPLCARRMAC
jgi:hypothetical protein